MQNKSLRTVSTYKIAGYKTATKFARNLCTARNTWIIWTKSVSRVHFITLNQSPRLEWEWFQGSKKARKHWLFWVLMPLVATIWQQNFIIHKKRAIWFQMKSGSSFLSYANYHKLFVLANFLSCRETLRILTFSARLPYHVLRKSALCSSVQPEVNVFRRGGESLSGF